ncbi:MAG: glycosyltransferase [Thioploca sp.]|nr:glycosyltransferase [Thioploca sp.]
MSVYILTLNWNGADKLESLMPGLSNNMKYLKKKKIDSRWIIKDNGSTDNSIKLVNDNFNSEGFDKDPVDIWAFDHNRDTFAEGMNFLASKTNANDDDYYLLLNNDIKFKDENSIYKMYKLIEDTGAGVVGARLMYTDTDRLQHAGVIFSKRYNYLPFHYRVGQG